jgi:HPt (histidine-containing phosphotransfer) domain-containing protein
VISRTLSVQQTPFSARPALFAAGSGEPPSLLDPPVLEAATVSSLEALGQKMGKDLFAKIAGTYLRTTPELVDQLRGAFASEGGEPAALEAGRQAAHSLKGSSAALGAGRVARAAASLEQSLKQGLRDRVGFELLENEYHRIHTELREKFGARIAGV